MVRTFGLTHIALAVEHVERSFAFYRDVFGMVPVYRETGFIQGQTPGCRDVTSRGEFCPGEPYLLCRDPDGYQIEIWHELPTPADPAPPGEAAPDA